MIFGKSIRIQSLSIFFILCSGIIYFSACKDENNDSKTSEHLATDTVSGSQEGMDQEDSLQRKLNVLSEKAYETIKSIQLKQSIQNTREFLFSNAETKDEFSFYIPAGSVGEGKSIMTISTSDKKRIYTDTINTISLAQWIIYPDSVSADLNRIQYLQFMIGYLNKINETSVRGYLEEKAGVIFSRIFREKSELKDPETMANMNMQISREIYNEILSSEATNIIFWPCFDCEEGGDYLGYSKSKKEVVKLASE